MNSSRREFIVKSMLAATALATANTSVFAQSERRGINIFSKNLHWLDYEGMATFAAETGFDGIDLTVRPDGHVEPARVSDDLPKAVDAVRKAGLQVPMIVTGITSADDKYTEPILKTAASLGISYYRMGWINYDGKKSMSENMALFKAEMKKIDELNRRYKIRGDYQNHSGTSFGSPVWDLWEVLKNVDSQWTGVQYDVMHAQVEGGNTWPLGLKLLKDRIRTIDIKDFIWTKSQTDNKWKTEVVPLGEGMVDYPRYLRMLKEYGLDGPFSMHFEYPLGGAEHGAKNITLARNEVQAAMKRDLTKFRTMLAEAGMQN